MTKESSQLILDLIFPIVREIPTLFVVHTVTLEEVLGERQFQFWWIWEELGEFCLKILDLLWEKLELLFIKHYESLESKWEENLREGRKTTMTTMERWDLKKQANKQTGFEMSWFQIQFDSSFFLSSPPTFLSSFLSSLSPFLTSFLPLFHSFLL